MTDRPGLLALADGLYALPQGEFTAARDALVKEHKGDKELAARIKALRKPSVAAWVVNLLVRRDPDQVSQLLDVGAALREAAESLDAAQLRELTKQRRQLTAAVTTAARRLAREEGHKVTQAVADQVEATLTAAMVDAGAADAVRSGLLVAALASTGVDAVDVSAAVALPEALGFAAGPRGADPPPRPELHVVPDPDADAKARAAAEERLASAEVAATEARSALDSAAEEVSELEARSMQLQSEVDELRRTIAEKEASLEEVDDELGDAEDVRAEAEDSLREAERELTAARAARERLA
jgi:septal ring factor EnvC (AmiA/AmiB activator)